VAPGHEGGAKAHYDCIKAFSETDFTEDLKAIDVPCWSCTARTTRSCRSPTAAHLSVKLLKNGTLKTYPGYPHGMLTTHAEVINPICSPSSRPRLCLASARTTGARILPIRRRRADLPAAAIKIPRYILLRLTLVVIPLICISQ
jgi:hypothetical protein